MKTIKLISFRSMAPLAAAVLLGFCAPSFAASTWNNLGSGCSATASSGVLVGNTLSCGSSNAVSLSASGFSTSDGATSNSGTVFATAALYNWGSGSGLGVVNAYEDPAATGPHAVDNRYGTDAVLLSFGAAVTLTSVGVGWVGSDSDFSVLAWTGGGVAPVAGKSLTGTVGTSTLLSSGWSLVGNYADPGTGEANPVTVASTTYSSYWLVSAYNTTFGTTVANGGTSAVGTGALDYFKLLSVAGNTKPPSQGGGVPEPTSLALMGIALTGLLAVRRRKGIDC